MTKIVSLRRIRIRAVGLPIVFASVLWTSNVLPAHGAPTVSLAPASVLVAPGDEFEFALRINEEADTFANFQVIFRFDPSIIEFLQALEGSLYVETGLPTWFHVEEESLGTWEVFDVILHGQAYVVAPGELARIRFEALSLGVSVVEFVSAVVTDRDRVPLDPLIWSNGVVFVDEATGVRDDRPPLAWEIGPPVPNPSRGAVRFRLTGPSRGASAGSVAVFDTRGRRVKDLGASAGGGPVFAEWDGRDSRGVLAPAGMYFLRWPTPDGIISRRMTLIR
ncbi:MAG: cohesin domain-containing protein [Candidatus Eisenbacteria bacterium]